ncbi:MAG: PIN domain-containing protein [Clostridia bacterium]|nr:PIN domain-containing protein [Clostridia bacterium]MBR0408136.1 PIN domain-containing protein [Clostridia bacterium]
MTDNKTVFLDTAPLIYFLDNNVLYAEKMMRIFDSLLSNNDRLVSSVITAEEYLVYPLRTGNQQKVDVFFEFTADYGIDLIPVSLAIAKKAAYIRAAFPSFKSMDALQLAAAAETGCDLFLTNDKQLKQFEEIPCVTVDEWNMEGKEKG